MTGPAAGSTTNSSFLSPSAGESLSSTSSVSVLGRREALVAAREALFAIGRPLEASVSSHREFPSTTVVSADGGHLIC